MNRGQANIGDFVTALGKPGIIIEILDGHETSCFRMKSADLIMRNQGFHNYSEIIDFGDFVKPATADQIIADADGCINFLKKTIERLEQFKAEVQAGDSNE